MKMVIGWSAIYPILLVVLGWVVSVVLIKG